MKLYAIMTVVDGQEGIISDSISANLAFVKADMSRMQARNDAGVYYVAVFDQVEKLTPPVGDWVSEKLEVAR